MATARTPTRPATSILSTFRTSQEVAPNNSSANAPQKFADTIDKQLEYVAMEIAGEELPLQGGQQRQARPRLWYWQKGGDWYVTVQYGNVKMDVTGNKKLLTIKALDNYKLQARPTIHAGKSLEDVAKTLVAVKAATLQTKELVPYIDHLADMIGNRLAAARSSH